MFDVVQQSLFRHPRSGITDSPHNNTFAQCILNNGQYTLSFGIHPTETTYQDQGSIIFRHGFERIVGQGSHTAYRFYRLHRWGYHLVNILRLLAKAFGISAHCTWHKTDLVLGIIIQQYVQYFFHLYIK